LFISGDKLWITKGQETDKKLRGEKKGNFLAKNKVQKNENFSFSFSLSQTQGKIKKEKSQGKPLHRGFQIRQTAN